MILFHDLRKEDSLRRWTKTGLNRFSDDEWVLRGKTWRLYVRFAFRVCPPAKKRCVIELAWGAHQFPEAGLCYKTYICITIPPCTWETMWRYKANF